MGKYKKFITRLIVVISALVIANIAVAEEEKVQATKENSDIANQVMLNPGESNIVIISPKAENQNKSVRRRRPTPSILARFFGDITTTLDIPGLEQFGYDLFDNSTGLTEPIITGAVGPDYILGPEDTLIVNLWGKISQRYELEIDRSGKVTMPDIGVIYLWGKTLGQAEKYITDEIDRRYTNVEIDISVGKLRSICVFVIGEIEEPGVHSLSSLSTIIHALHKAGGPTRSGSLRNIQLIRNNKLKATFDLYDLLLKGDASGDERLQSNDTIFVPYLNDIAAISGGVKRPGIYELKAPTRLYELAEMAGGLAPVAYLPHIQVIRVEDFKEKVVIDLEFQDIDSFKESENNIVLKSGDVVFVSSISQVKYNFVTITGNVVRPGEYQLTKDMRISDIIKQARGILPETYKEKAEINRFKSDKTVEPIPFNVELALKGDKDNDLLLKEWDTIHIFSIYDIFPKPEVTITGEVHKPGTYRYVDGMKISDLIFRANELTDMASLTNAELFRWNYEKGGPARAISIDLTPIMVEKDMSKDLLLEKGDHLFIRPKIELMEKQTVFVLGEVKYPGSSVIARSEGLSSVLKRAGGLTDQAFPEGAVFTRESLKEKQESILNELARAQEIAILKGEAFLAEAIMSQEEKEARQRALEYRRKALNLMAARTPNGRIIIELEQIINGKSNIILAEGDSINVPPLPDWVLVTGAVYHPESIVFAEGEAIEYYLNAVGGPAKFADKDNVYVIKANGRAKSKATGYGRISRGDIIVVPEKME